MVGNNLKAISWKSTGAHNLLHLKISSNCLLVIVLELADKANAIAFKIVYPALMHVIFFDCENQLRFHYSNDNTGAECGYDDESENEDKGICFYGKGFTTY